MPRTLLVLGLLLGCATSPPAPTRDEAPPTGQLPRGVRPSAYALRMEVDPAKDRFRGEADIDVELTEARQTLFLHARGLALGEARVRDHFGERAAKVETLDAEHGLVALTAGRRFAPGPVHLHFAWDGAWDEHLEGLYRVKVGGDRYAFTQFEAISARRAFPCFDDPGFKTPFDLTLLVPADATAAANTRVEEQRTLADGRHALRFARTLPLPTYLVAFAVGPFDVVEAKGGTALSPGLPIRALAAKGRGKELAYAVSQLGPIVGSLERAFGEPFPYPKLDLVAAPDFEAGGMENAGLVVCTDSAVLFDEGTAPVGKRRNSRSLLAHELAHQWFGDLVTLAWWDDLWLNEAFASWMGAKVVADLYPDDEADVGAVRRAQAVMGSDTLKQTRQIRQPIESAHDIVNAFDGITYGKGAAVLAMFERWLGPDVFRRGVQRYLSAHAHGSATGDDFLRALEEVSGKPVKPHFDTFLAQSGVPLVVAEVLPGAQVRLTQSRYLPAGSTADTKRRWHIPVCLKYGAGGAVKEQCTLLTDEEATVALEAAPDWLHPNAGASGYYRFALAPADLRALAAKGLPKLTVAERLAFAGSLKAAFDGATLSAQDVLAALAPLADDAHEAVAAEPMGLARFSLETLVSEPLRPSVRAWTGALYRPQLKRLGWTKQPGERPGLAGLREQVLELEAELANDPNVRQQTAALGRAYFGTDGAFHPEVVDPDLADLVLSVAAQEGGPELFDAMLARLKTTDDATLRERLLGALGAVRDPVLGRRAMELAFDDSLRVNERMTGYFGQLWRLETRDAAWSWLLERFDALRPRLAEMWAGHMPGAATRFCDEAHREQAERFFGPRVEKLPGGPRNLANALEQMTLCMEKVKRQRASADAFFAGLGTPAR